MVLYNTIARGGQAPRAQSPDSATSRRVLFVERILPRAEERRQCPRFADSPWFFAQGTSPTVSAVPKAASMKKSQLDSHPMIWELLQQWVGDFASRE